MKHVWRACFCAITALLIHGIASEAPGPQKQRCPNPCTETALKEVVPPDQPFSSQVGKKWYWLDKSRCRRTREELDEILCRHRQWALSKAKSGKRVEDWAISKEEPGRADLSGATLNYADLHNRDLRLAILSGVQLWHADLCQADLSRAELSQAILTETDLTEAILDGASLCHARFEPKSFPPPRRIARARDLDLLTYGDKPDALVQLRKQFQDGGFSEQERRITYALNRRQAELNSFVWRWLRTIAFDRTCKYGMEWWRPLVLAFYLWSGLSLLYFLVIQLSKGSGIYLVAKRVLRGSEKTREIRIRPSSVVPNLSMHAENSTTPLAASAM